MTNIWGHVLFHDWWLMLAVSWDPSWILLVGTPLRGLPTWPGSPYGMVAGFHSAHPKGEKARWTRYRLSLEVKPSLLPYSVNWGSPKCSHKVKGKGNRFHLLMRDGKVLKNMGDQEMLLWSYWENTTFDLTWYGFVSQFINKIFSKYGAVNTCAIVITEQVKCIRGLYKFFG